MIKRLVAAGAGVVLAVMTASGASASPKTAPINISATTRPHVKLSPTIGPPGSTVTVSGYGFGTDEAVDIYFDTTDEALAITGPKGAFHGITIAVPGSATPGTHWVTAVGRNSGPNAQKSFTVNTNWPQFHNGPLHLGNNTTENVLSPSNVSSIGLNWSYETGGDVDSSPAVVNGVVYVGSEDGNVYAINAATGAAVWAAPFPTGGAVFSSPAVVNGVVYVGSEDGNVYAINAATGAPYWAAPFPTGGPVESAPAVVNGVVYVGSNDGNVYAINAATGAPYWAAPFLTDGPVHFAPAVANGVVYIGSKDNVYAINATTGLAQWAQPFSVLDPVGSSPAVANGVVYIGTIIDGDVYAINAATGAAQWAQPFSTGVDDVVSSPAVANGVVYVGTDNNTLYAINAATGAAQWAQPFTADGFVDSSPAVANGVVYVGGGGNVYAINAAYGEEEWSYSTGGFVDSSPAVANGVVYVGSDDGNVYAFGLSGGTSDGTRRPDPATLRPDRKLRPSRG
jgi:outer membrane protein assembly factor BamB